MSLKRSEKGTDIEPTTQNFYDIIYQGIDFKE